MISRTDASNMVIDMYITRYNRPCYSVFDEDLFDIVEYVCNRNNVELFNSHNTLDIVYSMSECGIKKFFS